VYATFVDLSGDMRPNVGSPDETLRVLFGGSTRAQADHDPLTLMQTHRHPDLTGWFEAGRGDHSKLAIARQLEQAATAAGISARLVTPPGGHNYMFWRTAFVDVLPSLAERLDAGLT
jgi:S-formylglutathione hydrolase FrmB